MTPDIAQGIGNFMPYVVYGIFAFLIVMLVAIRIGKAEEIRKQAEAEARAKHTVDSDNKGHGKQQGPGKRKRKK